MKLAVQQSSVSGRGEGKVPRFIVVDGISLTFAFAGGFLGAATRAKEKSPVCALAGFPYPASSSPDHSGGIESPPSPLNSSGLTREYVYNDLYTVAKPKRHPLLPFLPSVLRFCGTPSMRTADGLSGHSLRPDLSSLFEYIFFFLEGERGEGSDYLLRFYFLLLSYSFMSYLALNERLISNDRGNSRSGQCIR